MTRRRRILFVTWDGPQATYVESLFAPIFASLGEAGFPVDILQFRWGTQAEEQRARAACEEAGCRYRAVPVWSPGSAPGALATALAGARHVRRAARDFGSDILMPRSMMPALSVMAAAMRSRPILFDADGLAADEKVEFGGLAAGSAAYRMLRAIEAAGVRRARSVLVRTEAAARILAERARVTGERFQVVANGRDPGRFRPPGEGERLEARRSLGLDGNAPLLVHAGSAGPQYRFDLVAATALAVRRRFPGARLLVLSSDPERAEALLDPEARDMAIVRSVAPEAVPSLLGAADLGLAFRQKSFSMQAVAPVKLAEYLLCGLPVIGTAGIGNTAPAEEAGLFLDPDGNSEEELLSWVERKLEDAGTVRNRAREVGLAHFSLERSVSDYLAALNRF